MQTLQQALHLAKSGKSRDLAFAANALTGCPEGGWAETDQARRQILEWLPLRCERGYTIDQFIAAAYAVDHAGRFQPLGAR